jgi:NAD(P)H-hydrate epimerase
VEAVIPVDDSLFGTAEGDPVTAVTAGEMRDVDRVAVEAFGVDLLQMMENAGRNLALAARERRAAGPVAVAAGDGGNGGGGLACARHLANHGVPVAVALDREPGTLTGAAAHQHATLSEMGVPVGVGPGALPDDPGLVVDALIGYGIAGEVRGRARDMVEVLGDDTSGDGTSPPVLSLDLPSGRDATTGEVLGAAVDPDAVLTLALPKTGLGAVDAPVVLADIAVPAGVYDRLDIPYDSPFDRRYRVPLRPADGRPVDP